VPALCFNSLFEMLLLRPWAQTQPVQNSVSILCLRCREGSQGERCRGAVAPFQFSV